MIRITIPIVPKAQKRDRIGTRGGHGFSYKDKAQKLEEDKLLTFLMASRPPVPLSGAISLEIRVYLPISQSKPKKWREKASVGIILPLVKPDFDNLAKQISDVMNGVFFVDDKQVCEAHIYKRYADVLGPRWEIILHETKQ